MKLYPADRIYEEIAYIAYHFHWSYSDLMNMDHKERQRWCMEIAKINEKINTELKKKE
jgi:transcriptional antiterminator